MIEPIKVGDRVHVTPRDFVTFGKVGIVREIDGDTIQVAIDGRDGQYLYFADELERIVEPTEARLDPDEVVAAIIAAPKIQAFGLWQTMVTAPKDGTPVLARGKHRVGLLGPEVDVVVGARFRWSTRSNFVLIEGDTYRKVIERYNPRWESPLRDFVPEFWMPLPSPPAG
jgi:hypothetical protein